MSALEPQTERLHQTEEICANEPGTAWIERLSEIFVEPYQTFKGDAETPLEFARYLWSTNGDEKVFHLCVSRALGEEKPQFRVDLNISSRGDHPSSMYFSAITHFVPDTKTRSIRFVGKDGNGDPDLALTLSHKGEFEMVWR